MRSTLLSLLLLAPALAPAQTEKLHALFSQAFEAQLRESPEMATNIGRNEYNDRWSDWSPAAIERHRMRITALIAALDQVSLPDVSAQDQLSAKLLRYISKQDLDDQIIQHYLLRVNPLYGFHNAVYVTVDRMPARTAADYENIIARLRAIPVYVDQNIALLDQGISQGIVQPRVVADRVTQQIAVQAGQDANATALLAAFRNFPSNIPKEEQEALRKRAVAAYEQQFQPAWARLHAYMKGTYSVKARQTTAVTALPNGKELYRLLIERATTTSMTPEEIHRLGESEVRRIEAEMEAVARETGFSGTLAEFQTKLAATPEQHFRSKDEMLAWCRNIAKIIEPQLPRLFSHMPAFVYGVRAIPEDREQASATNAEFPKPDGSGPGWMNLNTYQPEKQVRYDKESLTLHEAVPGHILQGAITQSVTGLPEFRRFYFNSAYGEGWALYAESLGSELGVYRDPYTRFGRLASERFRAVRLVVDTGLHALGWSREQAVAYFAQHAPEESTAEIDRYISWPAQALAYKIGELKIQELRRDGREGAGAEVRHPGVSRRGAAQRRPAAGSARRPGAGILPVGHVDCGPLAGDRRAAGHARVRVRSLTVAARCCAERPLLLHRRRTKIQR